MPRRESSIGLALVWTSLVTLPMMMANSREISANALDWTTTAIMATRAIVAIALSV
jgi:hypothetical protein